MTNTLNWNDLKEYFKDAIATKGSMSNLDHTIDIGLEEELKNNPKAIAEYAAWNFHGEVFYKNNKFHCAIMQFHQEMEILSANSLEELMTVCSEKYGYD